MRRKVAFITGINGQDGSYLAEYLLELGYEVHGTVRRNSVPENQSERLNFSEKNIFTHYADILDYENILNLINKVEPDEIYNLAAQSHVRISFELPFYTTQVNAIGAANLFNMAQNFNKQPRIYQASSSEMFGNSIDNDGFQRETTKMEPVSPYGTAKLFAYRTSVNIRNSHNIFIANGILFNHESPRRGSNFLTSKVILGAVKIKLGLEKKLKLGNLESERDWGHSREYVRAMHKILNHDEPDDFVVATGKTTKIKTFVQNVFENLELNYERYVEHDQSFERPNELLSLKGDSSKIKKILNFEARIDLSQLIEEMTKSAYDKVRRGI